MEEGREAGKGGLDLRTDEAKTRFLGAVQEPHETLEAWARRCLDLYQQAYPEPSRRHEMAAQAFIEGLRDQSIRRGIIYQGILVTCVRDALDAAEQVLLAKHALTKRMVGIRLVTPEIGCDLCDNVTAYLLSCPYKSQQPRPEEREEILQQVRHPLRPPLPPRPLTIGLPSADDTNNCVEDAGHQAGPTESAHEPESEPDSDSPSSSDSSTEERGIQEAASRGGLSDVE